MAQSKKYWVEQIGEGWTRVLKDTLRDPYMDKLISFLNIEYGKSKIKPNREDIFNAFKLCQWEDLKVVILGIDSSWDIAPNGLAFGSTITSAYQCIALQEIRKSIEFTNNSLCIDFDFSLESWAKQGVLLLNTSLTAPEYRSQEHRKPWNKFIQNVIIAINDYSPGTIFIVWGDDNNHLLPLIGKNSYLLTDIHPVTAGKEFKDWHSTTFKECNELLIKLYGKDGKINW